ncbi:hypothetical protein ES705_24662 [subsurface metagenome]
MQVTKLNKKTYHIEAEGTIINIQEGLLDRYGRRVTEVSIIPDNQIPENPVWHLLGHAHNRIVRLKNLKKR